MHAMKQAIALVLLLVILLGTSTACAVRRDESEETAMSHSSEVQEETLAKEDLFYISLDDLGSAYGYENALGELLEASIVTLEGDTFSRYTQCYGGVPVYGRSVVYVTDADGEMIALTGNPIDIVSVNTSQATISMEECRSVLPSKLAEAYAMQEDDISILFSEEDALCYFVGEEGEARLARTFTAVIPGSQTPFTEVVVDACNNAVLYQTPLVYREAAIGSSADDEDCTFTVEKIGSSYFMTDAVRGLYVRNLNEFDFYDIHENGLYYVESVADPVVSTDSIFGNTEEERALKYCDASLLMFFGTQIHDYYENRFDFRTATGKVYLYYNDNFDRGNNALGGLYTEQGDGLVSIGSAQDMNQIDLIGHEYTHIVSETLIGWKDTKGSTGNEPGAINEALSDIFGEILEGTILGKDPDWKLSDRNLSDPSSMQYTMDGVDYPYPDTYCGEGWVSNDFDDGGCHTNSTVLSHAAYLMFCGIDGTENKKLSLDELASLWYRAMLMMPSDCSFSECRKLVELAATSIGLTSLQISCVSEAFDAVGINLSHADYVISQETKLLIYDINDEVYGNYTYHVSGQKRNSNVYLPQENTKYEETVIVSSAEPQMLLLPMGEYTIRILDNEGAQQPFEFEVVVKPDGADTLEFYTAYGVKKEEPSIQEPLDHLDYEMKTYLIENRLSDGRVYDYYSITYPYFTGTSAIEAEMNEFFRALIEEESQYLSYDADESYARQKEYNAQIDNHLPYYNADTINVTYNKNNAFSYIRFSTMWSGGMHPYTSYYGVTYDLSNGEIPTYEDVLYGDESQRNEVLRMFFMRELTEYELKSIASTPWCLTSDGLMFYYWVGDAVNRLKITIPYTGDDWHISAAALCSVDDMDS